ncbi:MAG: SagB/ThcOx family dehydrogenase [Candidatus Portnoybacteria bacterium]|jgi:SagB-type dehydrogenase family enzyme|nr:SagB/ThcOx family dehydrogenase [Candidatus Portnoybacteria bacterium]
MADEIKFSQLFHQYTKGFHTPIPRDSSLWPDEWKTVYYKVYPRLPKTKLFHKERKFDLFGAIRERSSKREMNGGEISSEELSLLLKYSCGIIRKAENGDGRRAQPSGGARYPIETYCLVVKPGKGLKPGLFHYNVKDHCLETIWNKKFVKEDLDKIATYEFVKDASLIIFLTAVFWRNQNKYGERGYRFILQESGHIGQNIHLLSEALDLKCCSLGGFRISDEQIEKILDIDGVTESLAYTLAIGK